MYFLVTSSSDPWLAQHGAAEDVGGNCEVSAGEANIQDMEVPVRLKGEVWEGRKAV